MFPIMQNSFAHKKSDFKRTDPNTNTNTNTANSSSSSTATAENTNNITNSATASNSQEQSACAVAVTCPEGSTTVTPPPDPCPHSPYTDFVAGTGCQDGAQQTICNPSTIGGQTATAQDCSYYAHGTQLTQAGNQALACPAAGGVLAYYQPGLAVAAQRLLSNTDTICP